MTYFFTFPQLYNVGSSVKPLGKPLDVFLYYCSPNRFSSSAPAFAFCKSQIPKHLFPRCIQEREKWAMGKWGFVLFKTQGVCSFFRPWFAKVPMHVLHFRSTFIAFTCRPMVALVINYFPELVVLWPLPWRALQPSAEDPCVWGHSPQHACTAVWIHVWLHLRV